MEKREANSKALVVKIKRAAGDQRLAHNCFFPHVGQGISKQAEVHGHLRIPTNLGSHPLISGLQKSQERQQHVQTDRRGIRKNRQCNCRQCRCRERTRVLVSQRPPQLRMKCVSLSSQEMHSQNSSAFYVFTKATACSGAHYTHIGLCSRFFTSFLLFVSLSLLLPVHFHQSQLWGHTRDEHTRGWASTLAKSYAPSCHQPYTKNRSTNARFLPVSLRRAHAKHCMPHLRGFDFDIDF